jgi:hypothetical protein
MRTFPLMNGISCSNKRVATRTVKNNFTHTHHTSIHTNSTEFFVRGVRENNLQQMQLEKLSICMKIKLNINLITKKMDHRLTWTC